MPSMNFDRRLWTDRLNSALRAGRLPEVAGRVSNGTALAESRGSWPNRARGTANYRAFRSTLNALAAPRAPAADRGTGLQPFGEDDL